MQPFSDISISGINRQDSIINEWGNSEIHLQLTNLPPGEWSVLFTDAWSDRMYSMKQPAEIFGQDLVIHCHHSVLMKDHMPELEKAVATANEQYRAYQASNQVTAQAEPTEKAHIDQVLDDLDAQFKACRR